MYCNQVAPDKLLDVRDPVCFRFCGKADGGSACARATCTADAVQIILRIHWKGIIDYVADAIDV